MSWPNRTASAKVKGEEKYKLAAPAKFPWPSAVATAMVLLTIAVPPVMRGPASATSNETAEGAINVAPVNWITAPFISLEDIPLTAKSKFPSKGTEPCAANKTEPLAGMYAVAPADNTPTGPTGVSRVPYALKAPWNALLVKESGVPLADNSKGPNNPTRPNAVLSDTVAVKVPWNPPPAGGTLVAPSDTSKGPSGVVT